MRYYVCIALPARHARRIAALAEGVCTPPSDPHITLVGPGDLNACRSETELVSALRAAVSGLTVCPVAYDGVAHTGTSDYFYVRVPRTPWLVRWHQACLDAARNILALPAPAEFTPHITLATKLSSDEGDALRRAVGEREVQDLFLCKEFILMRQIAHNASWQRLARLRLAQQR